MIRSYWPSMRVGLGALLCVVVLVACTEAAPATTPSANAPVAASPEPTVRACTLSAVTNPPVPAVVPGYTEEDPATGLHMTGTVQYLDLASYRLSVVGKVEHPLSLTFDELRCLPKRECYACLLVCPGFFQDHADWAGASLAEVLGLAGIKPDAASITLESADGYRAYLRLDEALADANFLAYEQGGEPLPILHGFPVRAVLPGQAGGNWVKWLVRITVE